MSEESPRLRGQFVAGGELGGDESHDLLDHARKVRIPSIPRKPAADIQQGKVGEVVPVCRV